MRLKHLHYGWVMVILAIYVLAVHSMAIYTFGIFLVPVTLQFDWERGALSLAQAITMLVGGGLAIFTGRLSDKYGPRLLVTFSGFLAGVVFLLMSRISALWQAYLVWGLLMGVAFGCCMIPVTSTIPRWFTRRRGIAVGLTMVGFGLGEVIWPPVAQWLISAYGWQQAYVTLGIITLIIVIPVAQFMKHSPQRMGLKPYGENGTVEAQFSPLAGEGLSLLQVSKTGRFWIFSLVTFSFVFCMQSIVVHIAPHAIDSGILAIVAASLFSIIAVVSLIGRLGIGFISDRAGATPALAACLAIFTLALLWLLFAEDSWMFYVFAVVFGLAYGGEAAVMTLVPVELFGLKYLGIITAATFFMGAVGGAIGSPLAGHIFDVTGSYDLAFIICIIISALAFILSMILWRSRGKGYLVVAE